MTAPPDLRAKVARDLTPARPLRPPLMRALVLVSGALAILVASPLLHFFGPDSAAIGFIRAWGFSVGQAIAGLVIVGAALREAIPGRSLPWTAVAVIVLCGLALPAVLLVLTAPSFDIGPRADHALTDGIMCFRVSAVAALPALIVAAFLAARAFPMRPSVAGALYGLGGGLIADAGLRLYCEYSQPGHVIFAHGGAIAVSIVVGVALGWATRRP